MRTRHLIFNTTWWRHQMETFSALLAICAENSPGPGEFPAQRPVTRSFDVFFDQHPNKRLSKQWWGWWFETPSCSLWRHCNAKYATECSPWAHQPWIWKHTLTHFRSSLLWLNTPGMLNTECIKLGFFSLRWRHNERDSVSNHQPHDCLFNCLFRRISKKTSKLRVTGLCAGNSPGTGEFPAQRASNAENVSIWWRHHIKFRQNVLTSAT